MTDELISIIIERSILVVAIVLFTGIVLILENKFIIENKNKYLTRFFNKFKIVLSGNMISIYRIVGGPICGYLLSKTLYYQDYSYHDILIPLIAGLAAGDFLDGVVARSCNAESKLGMILDPLGDKSLIHSLFIGIVTFLLLQFGDYIFFTLVMIMLIPEGIGTFLRSKMSNPAAAMIGKCKTTYQFLLIGVMYYCIIQGIFIEYSLLIIIAMIIAIMLTSMSAIMKNWSKTKTA